MFVRVQVPPSVQSNPQPSLRVLFFLIDLKSLFKKQRFCFENNSIGCTKEIRASHNSEAFFISSGQHMYNNSRFRFPIFIESILSYLLRIDCFSFSEYVVEQSPVIQTEIKGESGFVSDYY